MPPLPSPLTPLVGREHEVAEAVALLTAGARLVTLTGPGGVGKTRLALAVAAAAAPSFAAGVHFVELAPVASAEAVLGAIAAELGIAETRGWPLSAAIAVRLGNGPRLLVLDNFEHVLAAGPDLCALLVACPDLAAVVTSRARLRLSGEHEFSVEPLALPPPSVNGPAERLGQYSAVRLFVERARAAAPHFGLTEENGAAVADVCRRLDGLPLAIELAAARLRILSPAALAGRLTRRLPLLTAGPRDAPARQQSMRDAIAWSDELLGERERRLF